MALGALFCSHTLLAGSVYQWKDSDGRTVFSQQRPADGAAIKVPKKGGTASSAALAPIAPATAPPRSEKKEVSRKPLSEEDQRKLAQGCDQARDALRLLRETNRPRYIDENGERAYLTEAMKAERTADAERKANEYCQTR